ncbi:MAG: hypothetical protein ACJAXX_001065 [Roseivirga sp.]|jgi:hypothetical protein
MNRFSALLLIFVLSACEKEEPVLSEEPFCVEGEFRQVNPNCVMDSAVGDGIIYDIRIYNHSDLDSITVPGEDIPNAFRVKGNRFYFQIDSTGVYSACNALFSPTFPYRISNVSATPCGETANNF